MPHGAVRVRVPASSANLGPGFDSIGLALGLWDEYVAEVTDAPGLVVEVSGEGAGEVPTDERHLVYRSMLAGWADLGVETPPGLRLTAVNGVPHGRGLGSSATAIVAGVAAALALADVVDPERLNHLAARQEGHPDNSSASVHGGLTVSWTSDDEGLDAGRTRTACIPVHPDVIPVVFVPHERLATEVARKALPATVPLREAALNSGRAALLIEAVSRRPDLLLPATREWLHQEARRPAFAASMDLVDELRAGGHAAAISGAGPSVLVLATSDRVERVVADLSWRRLLPGIPAYGATVTRL
jgi:homoserine kinase